jgi:ABC-type uncharacterized transport system permease subunit
MRWAIKVVQYRAICSGYVRRRLRGTCRGSTCRIVYTPQWVENMTAGRGWIALALVVFCFLAANCASLAGAYLFGAVSIRATCMPRRWSLGHSLTAPLELFPISPRLLVLVIISAESQD